MLSGIQGDLNIETILECYTCKMSSCDKDLYNSLEKELQNPNRCSPSSWGSPSSPFGSMMNKKNRSVFIYLIATLSSVFPDINFSKVKDSSFQKIENYGEVVNHIDTEYMGR